MKNILFKNRKDAFNQLSNILPIEEMCHDAWIVIATSAGAVPIAFELSKSLNADFDFIFTHKINAPKNSECEVAIITETQEIVIHEEIMKSFNIKLEDIYKKADKKYINEISKYIEIYRDGRQIIEMKGKNVLLVDEGLNTGLTMMACIKSVVSSGASSVSVAVPVLPRATISDIESIADDLYYINALAHFVSIDFYYDTLEDIDMKQVKNIINKKG
jgi:putative phosphoribosyl transferase